MYANWIPSIEISLRVQLVKAWSHCHYGCREDVKRKKYLAIRWKTLCIRCVPIACVLHTLYPSSIRPLWFHPRKRFWAAQNFRADELAAVYNVLFSQVFANFVNFWSGWKRMEPAPKFCSSALSFLHTFCVRRPVGPGLYTYKICFPSLCTKTRVTSYAMKF